MVGIRKVPTFTKQYKTRIMNYYLKIEANIPKAVKKAIDEEITYWNNYRLNDLDLLQAICNRLERRNFKSVKFGRSGSHIWIHNMKNERIAMIYNNPPTKY